MRKITATVITYNEADRIELCLKSLQGVADEIIVVDSFSSDNTLELCKHYDCIVTQRRFNGYGAQKQYAVSLSTYYCDVPIRHCGWQPDRPIRLFDKRYASWNLRDVHETVIFPGTLRPEPIPGHLIHHRCSSPMEYRHKEERYATINSRILSTEGRRASAITPYVKAAMAFLRIYLRRLGCLDGREGLEISRTAAHSAFATYKLLRRRRR